MTLKVEGMTCGGCVAAVKVQLKKTAGVTAYEVSLEKGEADVTYDSAKTDPGKIAESVSQSGFHATVKEAKNPQRTSSIGKGPDVTAEGGHLDLWTPVDAAFAGCSEGVCGRRGRDARAAAQPGAQAGERVYCPVSGAVFVVKESSVRAEVNGRPYTCAATAALGTSRKTVIACSRSDGCRSEGSQACDLSSRLSRR